MRPLLFTKSFAVLALALGTFATGSLVHAHSDIRFSIGVQVPGIVVQPVPMHVQPQPFYQPAPEYYRRQGGVRSYGGLHWQHRGPYGDHDRNGIANLYDPGGPRNQWRQGHLNGLYGDLDRDGILNRHDRDRDGDGVRNRYDRNPNNPFRR